MHKTVYVSSDLIANFSCPECGKRIHKDVSKFVEHKTQVKLKYKCSCRHSFPVILERRQSIRKEVSWTGCVIQKSKKYSMIVKDISRQGIKISMQDKIPLELGGKIEIEFSLDDPGKSIISREVRVNKILSPTDIGCRFISSEHYGSLGKYFLFYF